MKTIELPKKASEGIIAVLHDLERVENSPDYIVEMGVYHYPIDTGQCEVCLAGALITRHTNKDDSSSPANFDNDIQILAFDSLRKGYFGNFFKFYTNGQPDDENNRLIANYESSIECYFNDGKRFTYYHENKEEFKNQLIDFAMFLDSIGE